MGTWDSIRRLPAQVKKLLVADFVSNVGTGLVVPFLAIYAARIRGHGVAFGGVTVATLAIGSLLSNAVAGKAADRFGPAHVLRAGWLTAGAGDLLLLASSDRLPLLAAALVIGVGVGAAFPALRTAMGELTSGSDRKLTFSVQYGLLNIAFSLGALVAAVIVSNRALSHFQVLYAIDAASFCAAAAILRIGRKSKSGSTASAATGSGGYIAVVRDAAFRRFALVSFLLVVCGFAQFHAALPLYLSRPNGLSPAAVAGVFAANTITVGVAALPVAHAVRRVSYRALIFAGSCVLAFAWLLLAESGRVDSGLGATLTAAAAGALIGVSETLLAPALGPLLNDLAPDDQRGHYNAADAVILSVGTIVGPPVAAVLYSGSASPALFGFLVGGCACAACVAAGARKAFSPRPQTADKP